MTDITNLPQPSKEPQQRSISYNDMYMTRFMPPWSHPGSLGANVWRSWVLNEPIAMVCRETIIAYLLSLDWKITPRDSDMYDELKPTIKYYTKLIENGGFYLEDYDNVIEWMGADLLDIPFGTAMEVGRKGDTPNGRVAWFKPLDGATLYPTLNADNPIVQWYNTYDVVVFPAHAIARSYMSPVPNIIREGWGMAPPEKIQLALEMLLRGDRYYANLLLDVPSAGILDLGDMEQSAAQEWVNAFRLFVANTTDALKIPVLYEHTSETKFIPFGKVPNDLMYDKITMKYAAIVAAAYGMSLSDIGLQTTTASGETLAGSIRQERRTRKTGIARAKKKFKYLFQKILPDYLQFDHIDLDDELNLAVARARLANSTAWKAFIETGVFDRKEVRLQTIQDGLVTINVGEEPPAQPDVAVPVGGAANRQLGNKVAPSAGGMGEIKSKIKLDSKESNKILETIIHTYASDMLDYAQELGQDNLIFGIRELSLAYEDSLVTLSNSFKSPLVVRKNAVAELHGVKIPVGEWKTGFEEFVARKSFDALTSVLMDEDEFDDLDGLDYDSLTIKCQERLSQDDILDLYIKSKLENISLEDKKDESK